jgi:phosphoglycolate/pyridoxal phosphate phosphatase family enzyme
MLSEKKIFIFDLDGVVYRGSDPIPSAITAINKLKTLGKKIVFLTNNATKTRESFAKKLNSMGIPANENDIYTSSYLATIALAKEYPKGQVFVIGEEGLIYDLKHVGFTILNEKYPELDAVSKIPAEITADFVIVGMDTKVTYYKFRTALMLINKGAHFYATNDDANFPAPDTIWPGAGANVAFVSTAAMQPPRKVFGKPYPYGIEMILSTFRFSKETCVAIGDRLNTDILAGNRAGVDTVCVGTGISTEKEIIAAQGDLKPRYYFSTLLEMMNSFFS